MKQFRWFFNVERKLISVVRWSEYLAHLNLVSNVLVFHILYITIWIFCIWYFWDSRSEVNRIYGSFDISVFEYFVFSTFGISYMMRALKWGELKLGPSVVETSPVCFQQTWILLSDANIQRYLENTLNIYFALNQEYLLFTMCSTNLNSPYGCHDLKKIFSLFLVCCGCKYCENS